MIASGGYLNITLVGYGPPVAIVPKVQLTILGGQTVFVPGVGLGLGQLNFQWQYNGTNLAGENKPLLTLVGTQAMPGAYSLTISNSYGIVSSSNIVLNVIPLVISNSPVSQTVLAGTNLFFNVTPTGWMPFNYQWQFNGTNILYATNATSRSAAFYRHKAGEYAVAVSVCL